MGRRRYTIDERDLWFAWRWLERKLENPVWLGERRTFDAARAFAGLDYDAAALNGWCETWLDAARWTQLKNAVRAGRRRAREPELKSVTLSRNAWLILERLARREGCTLSEAIERRLGRES